LNCPGSKNADPTPAPVPTPDGLLTVYVDTDPFSPEDLGWELTSVPNGDVVASRPIGYYANQYGKTLSEEVIVSPETFYRFTVIDNVGDGFQGEISGKFAIWSARVMSCSLSLTHSSNSLFLVHLYIFH